MNFSHHNTIAQNAGWLLLSEFVGRIISFVAVIWLVAYLGDTAYGELAYALAVANILVVIADFGLSTYISREVARSPEDATTLFGRTATVKLIVSGIAVACMVVAGAVLPNVSWIIVGLGGAGIVAQSGRVYIEAFFRGLQQMHFETITKLIASVSVAGSIVVGIVGQMSIEAIAGMYLVAGIVSIGSAVLLYWRVVGKPTMRIGAPLLPVALAALPFAATVGINYIFNYLDATMLGMFGYVTANGWYSAAYKPIFFITAVAGMIISAYFPAIAEAWQHQKKKVPALVEQLFRINMLVAIPMAVGGTVVANDIVALLFPPEFAPATFALQILLWSTATIYFWAVFGNTLQACDQEKLYLRGFMYGAVINIGLNLILIPQYSLYGAALATYYTQLFLAGFMVLAYRRNVGNISMVRFLLRPIVASLCMVACIIFVERMWIDGNLAISLAVGVLSYTGVAVLIRAIGPSELAFAKSFIHPLFKTNGSSHSS